MKKKIAILILLSIIGLSGNAQSTIDSGSVSGHWTKANSPYLINGHITVPADSLLTIDPGVTIEFQGHYKFNVQGRVLAIGAVGDTIIFTVRQDSIESGWWGIRFDNTPSTQDSSIFEYCKVEYGNARGSNYNDKCGGAFYIFNFSKVKIAFSNIYNNKAISDGGGIYCSSNLGLIGPIINENIINYNIAGSGGGISAPGNAPIIQNNYINNNSVTGWGGGGIYIGSNNSIIKANQINYNSAPDGNGGGIFCYSSYNLIISDNIINHNSASHGGGVATWGVMTIITNNKIINNLSSNGGGGIGINGNKTKIINCIIVNNDSKMGAGIYSMNEKWNTEIYNSIISKNNSILGGGGFYSSDKDPIIKNVIFWGNTANNKEGNQIYLLNDTPLFLSCNIEGGINSINTNGFHYTGSYKNNIDSDPLFTSPTAGAGSSYDASVANWTLQSSSPCIDAGTPDTTGMNLLTTDIANNPRISGCRVDIGAYEFQNGTNFIACIDQLQKIMCHGDSTATAVVTSSNGNAPYAYLWSDGQTSDTVIGLHAGTYTVTVTDNTAKKTTAIIQIGEPNALTSIVNAFNTTCNLTNGSTMAIASGGIAPYKYSWSNSDTTTTIIGLDTLSYYVTITDNAGCKTSDTAKISNTLQGNVSGTWTKACSPYKITGDITVPKDSKLTIEAGVVVEFQGHYKLNVQGQIYAFGSLADTVIFTASDTSIGWGGIRFNNTPKDQPKSNFVLCKVMHGKANGIGNDGYGGAFYINNYSNIYFSSCLITKNSATSGGGLFFSNCNSDLFFNQNTISNNLANSGGGVYFEKSPIVFYKNNILFNNAIGTYMGGGGVYIRDCDSTFNFFGNSISNNTSKYGWGGGLFCKGGNPIISGNTLSFNEGAIMIDSTSAKIDGNIISNNIGWPGPNGQIYGGIYCWHGELNATGNTINNNTGTGIVGVFIRNVTIKNNNINHNNASNGGGGIDLQSGKGKITNNTITYNITNSVGGGIFIAGEFDIYNNFIGNNLARDGYNGGGGICSMLDHSKIYNNTIVNNSALKYGGGIIFVNGGSSNHYIFNNTISNNSANEGGGGICFVGFNESYILKNNICTGNISGNGNGNQIKITKDGIDPTFIFNNIQGGVSNFDLTGGKYTGIYLNNIDALPMFVSPTAGADTTHNASTAIWTLQPASSCVNAGTIDTSGLQLDTIDIAGNPRISGCRIDMGAYEYQSQACASQPQALVCYGDSNASLSISPAFGNAPYTYAWSNGQITDTATGLKAGIYTVTITDSSAVSVTEIFTITEPAQLITNNTQTICEGNAYKINNHLYKMAGIYYDTLTSVNGCDSIVITDLKIFTIDVKYTAVLDSINSTATFTNTSTGPNKFYWQFDDGIFSNINSPIHKYSSDGIYRVSLTATDSTNGCQTKIENEIKIKTAVIEPCRAAFAIALDTIKKIITCTNNSTGANITRHYWEFGDGTLSNALSPVHAYASAGYYAVSLTVIDTSNNCVDSKRLVVNLADNQTACKADFTYSVDLSTQTITFADKSDVNDSISYLWDFNDGYLSTLSNPEHVYKEGGYYDVCLTVNNAKTNCKNTACQQLKASDAPEMCQASFTYSVDTLTGEANFYNNSKGRHLGWTWEFGNGNNDKVKNAKQKYAPGYYTVILKVTDSISACTSFDVKVINVKQQQKLKAGFGYEKKAEKQKGVLPVEFKGASYGDASEIEWDFGDGTSNSSSIAPTHDYQTGAIYTACLKVYNAYTGQSDSVCQDVNLVSTGLAEMVNNNAIHVYPNPAKQSINISFGTEKINSIEIINILGQTLNKKQLEGKNSNEQMDISPLVNGVYFAKIHIARGVVVKMFVKE